MKRDLVDAYLRKTLGQSLEQYLTDRSDEGMSWRDIAAHLRDATDGAVSVSHETVRTWSRHYSELRAAS